MTKTILLIDYLVNGLTFNYPPQESFRFFFLAISGASTGGLIWYGIGLYLLFRRDHKFNTHSVPLLLAGLGAWLSTELVFKPYFGRLRPISVGFQPEGYAFPSAHAAISWAAAYILAQIHPSRKFWFYGLAILVCYSRLYLGQHYLTDVVAGGLWGVVVGSLVWNIFKVKQIRTRTSRKSSP